MTNCRAVRSATGSGWPWAISVSMSASMQGPAGTPAGSSGSSGARRRRTRCTKREWSAAALAPTRAASGVRAQPTSVVVVEPEGEPDMSRAGYRP